MVVSRDPEGVETQVVQELLDFSGKAVLEVGSGDGRMTWRYATEAHSVVALDPDAAALARAEATVPTPLRAKVRFWHVDITTAEVSPQAFDVALLSWSLCCVPPERMLAALDAIHTALRPDGLLLDVRPARRHPWVEVQQAHTQAPMRLGQINDAYRIGTQVAADAALQAMIAVGRLQQERKTRFLFVYHFETPDAWLDYMAADWQSARVSRRLIARVREALLTEPRGEVRILRWITAARYRRIGAQDNVPSGITSLEHSLLQADDGRRPSPPTRGTCSICASCL
jgi:SAM-dependent methyltransferase